MNIILFIKMVYYMSKELQDRADRMMKELKDSLVPIQEEIIILKNRQDKNNT